MVTAHAHAFPVHVVGILNRGSKKALQPLSKLSFPARPHSTAGWTRSRGLMHKLPAKLQINSVLTSPQSSFIPNKPEAQAHAQAQLMLQTGGKDIEKTIIGPFIICYFTANN